ncbi:hypothetical protein LOAG_09673 [Loa loa]|uniref:Uncharacterized protein n=1 Tax=Loa loa TaxID=7209 RepID=A0A1S0TR86_LOALO|nr:hypothetical protein LOAG_09673 [Loa loa]EFO18821.1 hypothetical protein LOAG_09673 [Loa loa]
MSLTITRPYHFEESELTVLRITISKLSLALRPKFHYIKNETPLQILKEKNETSIRTHIALSITTNSIICGSIQKTGYVSCQNAPLNRHPVQVVGSNILNLTVSPKILKREKRDIENKDNKHFLYSETHFDLKNFHNSPIVLQNSKSKKNFQTNKITKESIA